MKFIVDFLPIVLFFVGFKWAGSSPEHSAEALALLNSVLPIAVESATHAPILLATLIAIIATVLLIAFQKLNGKPVETMQWVGLVLIILFGGMTLAFQNETFIKWKPTVLYIMMAGGFLISNFLKKNPIQLMMKGQIDLPDYAWDRLLNAWVLFFLVMAGVNLAVAYSFSTDIWVDFKLFGALGATFLFVVGQGIYISRHVQSEPGRQ